MSDPTILRREALEKIINEVQTNDEMAMPLVASGVLARNATEQTSISYDIRRVNRDIGAFQGHGAPAGTRKLEVIGKNSFEFPHTFESKTIPGAVLLNLRNPGSDRLQRIAVDQVTREQVDNARHLNRQDEFMLAGALQGAISMKLRSGAQERAFSVDYQFSADHKLAFGGEDLGNACLQTEWSDPAAPIMDDLDVFIQKVVEDSGYRITRAYTSQETLTMLVKNNFIKDYFQSTPAGAEFARTGAIRDLKGITWFPHNHVYDAAGTMTRFIPKNRIIFTPEPDANWGEWFEAGAVTDGPNGPERTIGRYSFSKSQHNPPSAELFYGSSRGPVIYVPDAVLRVDVTA